jgi:hypothetical protein
MTGSYDAAAVPSDRSRGVALALAAVLGPFGAHRFYVGKTGTGVLMLCTIGGAGLWYLYDLLLVAAGSFRDAGGPPDHPLGPGGSPPRYPCLGLGGL